MPSLRTSLHWVLRCSLVLLFYVVPLYYYVESQQASEELLKRITTQSKLFQQHWKHIQVVWLQNKLVQYWCTQVHIVSGLICASSIVFGFLRHARYKSFVSGWILFASACVGLYHTNDFSHIHVSMISLAIHVLVCRWIATEMKSAFTSGLLHTCSELFVLTLIVNLGAYMDPQSIVVACGVMFISDHIVFRVLGSENQPCYTCDKPLA